MTSTRSKQSSKMSKRATQVALNSLTSIRELRDFKKALDLPSLKEIAKLLRPLSTKSNGRAPPSKKLLQEVVAALMLGPANLPSAWSKLTLVNAVLVWVQKALSIKEINDQNSLFLKMEQSTEAANEAVSSTFTHEGLPATYTMPADGDVPEGEKTLSRKRAEVEKESAVENTTPKQRIDLTSPRPLASNPSSVFLTALAAMKGAASLAATGKTPAQKLAPAGTPSVSEAFLEAALKNAPARNGVSVAISETYLPA